MTTPAQALSNQGFCNGIEFTADGVVNVADAAKNRIGTSTIPANPPADRRAVSVRTGAAAMGNPDGRGTLNFSVDATVEGRVGDALTEANADNTRRIFKAMPGGRLKLIRIGSSGSTATPTVTFNTPPKGFVFDRTKDRSANISRFIREGIGVGGVGAKRLQFETDGTVVLAEQSMHSFPTYYDIDQVLTQMNGQGALILKNNNSSVFRGTIGAPGKKLKSVTINSDLISNGLVRILGDIYANTIWLNTRTARVGANPSGLLRLSGSGFGTTQPADPYMVDADVKTRFNTRGTFEIDVGAYYELRGQIGMNGSELINVNLQPNARAIVHKDIYSEDVYMYSKSTLTVQKNLTIAGRLTAYNRSSVSRGLSSTIIRGGTTLALGNHTLSVKGAVTFTNDVPGNPHTLSLTLDGAGSGQLDASAGGVMLSSGTNPLNIRVNVPDPGSIANGQSFILIKGNASFSTYLSGNRINLITPSNSPLGFTLSARGNDLVLTATRSAPPPTVTIDAPSAHNGSPFVATFTFSKAVSGFDAAADITVTGGSAAAPRAVGAAGTTYRATITPATPASGATLAAITLAVPAAAARDASGDTNVAASAVTVSADSAAPTVTIDAPSAHNGAPFTVTFTFNEAVSGFDAVADITVTGGTAAAPRAVGAAGTTYRATITPATPASGETLADITLAVPAAAARDAAGNGNIAAGAVTVSADSAAPTVTIDAPSVHNGAPFTVTFTFNEAVSGFDAVADITVTGGSAAAPRAVGAAGTTYRATITPATPASGATLADITLAVPAAAARDAAGNGNIAASAVTVSADSAAPTVTIDAPSAHNGNPFTVTFTFNEAVSGFDAVADITVTGGSAAALRAVGAAGTTYRATITPATPASGATLADITLAVPAAAARDAAGNGNIAASAVTVSADSAAPTVTIDAPSAHNGAPFTVTFTFNEAVSGFDAVADITVTGGSAAAPRAVGAAGTTYRATITPATPASGATLADITLAVPAAAARDAAGNTNVAAGAVTVSADSAAPTVTIDAPSAHNGNPFTVTFTFNEAVSGFDAVADITVTGGSAAALRAVGAASTTYQATITPATPASGQALADITLAVPAAAARDAAGNNNVAASAVTVSADSAAPTVTIDAPSAHNGNPFTVTFTFNEAVSGFDAVADITVTGGTAAAPRAVGAAGTTYRATITPATPASGETLADITLAVPAAAARDAAGNTSVAASAVTVTAKGKPGVSPNDRGDLALVPYYTVAGDWVTGLHIVNTSKRTQVVKVRFRRATDAMDALDFNVVLSPHDVYAGFLSDDEQGVIAWTSPDSSCTAPAAQNNRLSFPAAYSAGAETGYIEVIAMGSPSNERQPLARAARHAVGSPSAPGVPLDCAAVRSNFFADGAGTGVATSRQGVQDRFTTWQAASSAAVIRNGGLNTYVDSGNVLKVSYFIRDNATGIEFGDNAVHIRDFLVNPALSNQQYGVFVGDLNGFDFPDLNGGVPRSSGSAVNVPIQRGRFNALRAPEVLGVGRIVNEWSANPANGVEMNWVVTLPGQYVMLKLPQYVTSLASTSSATGGAGRPWAPTLSSVDPRRPLTNPACPRNPVAARAGAAAVAECDYRDMPVELTFTAYTREEGSSAGAEPQLVVSPAAPGAREKTYLAKAVNVITFGQRRVFGGGDVDVSAPNLGQPYGWVSARVTSRDTDLRVCDWDRVQDNGRVSGAAFPSVAAGRALTMECTAVTNKAVPVIGFAAWSRKVAANPDASYGRIVEHSYR